MNQILILLLVVFSVISISAKDIVITNDGNEYKGKVLKYSETEVVIKLNEENTLTFPIDEVEEVIFDKEDFRLESNRKPKNGFPVLGLTFGSPGGFNFTVGYYWRLFSARYSIGAFPGGIFGQQLMLQLPYYINKNIIISPSITIGSTDLGDEFEGATIYDYDNNSRFVTGTRLKEYTVHFLGAILDTHIYGLTFSIGYAIDLNSLAYNSIIFDVGYKIA